MPSISTASEVITLAGGFVVPVTALRLAWALEARGCVIRLEGDGLLVGPRHRLTARDRAAIVAHRDELIAIVRHCCAEAIQ